MPEIFCNKTVSCCLRLILKEPVGRVDHCKFHLDWLTLNKRRFSEVYKIFNSFKRLQFEFK